MLGSVARGRRWDMRSRRKQGVITSMPRMSLALVVALVGALASVFSGVAGAAAPPLSGMIAQLAAPSACLSSTAANGCAALGLGLGFNGAGPLTVSNDGQNVYVGNLGHGDTVSFTRGPGGALTTLGGVPADATTDGIQQFATEGAGVFGAVADNDTANGGVAAYARGTDGKLTLANVVADNCPQGQACAADDDNGLDTVFGVTVAPDGKHVYAVSGGGGGGVGGGGIGGGLGALTVFSRDQATQTIAEQQCVPAVATSAGLCATTDSPALIDASGVAVSPDGKFLYTTTADGDLVGFDLVQSGAKAGQIGSQVNCLSAFAIPDGCQQSSGIEKANALAISPDGRDVYVAANEGIGALHRDTATGALSFTQCFTSILDPACTKDTALQKSGFGVVVSPDGRYVYFGGGTDSLGYVVAYVRDAESGTLTRLGCINRFATDGCVAAAGMSNVAQIAITPDSRYLYTAGEDGGDGDGAVVAFRIEGAPSCTPASVNVLAGQSVTIPLACTHSSGDPLTLGISPAQQGTLGQIDQQAGTVTYTAAANASGDDVLTFQASDGTNVTQPALATVHITPIRVEPPPPTTTTTGTTTTPPVLIDATVPSARIAGLKRRVKATALKGFGGTASDDRGIARVEVSLVRLGGGAKIARATCAVLSARGTFHAVKASHGRCTATGFLRAKGTTHWSFPLKHRLPKGSYVLTVRAIDSAGNVARSFSSRAGNRVAFTVTSA